MEKVKTLIVDFLDDLIRYQEVVAKSKGLM